MADVSPSQVAGSFNRRNNTLKEETDQILVRKAKLGNRRALDQLLLRYQGYVWAVALGMLKNPDDASDAMQDALIAFVRHLDDFNERSLFSTWLHRITIRKCLDQLRRRRPVPVAPDDAAIVNMEKHVNVHDQHLQQSEILDALQTIDENWRQAVLLVDVAGCTIEEAALALDVAQGTVKSRVFRGRAKLAESLTTAGYRPGTFGADDASNKSNARKVDE